MENCEITWEEELQQMELEKESAKKVYADKLAEQKKIDIENERYRIKRLHKLDCEFLKEYNMTYEETKEYYKDDPEWIRWFGYFSDNYHTGHWTSNGLKDWLSRAPNKEDTKSHIIEKYICG